MVSYPLTVGIARHIRLVKPAKKENIVFTGPTSNEANFGQKGLSVLLKKEEKVCDSITRPSERN